jgi:non-ribosomal peptide synthetase component F
MSHQILAADKWPLFEICVTRLDQNRDRLHISLDALTGDAHSFNLLFADWRGFYQNPDRQVERLELSFRDYVLKENELRNSERAHRSEEYWFSRISSLPAAPDLPLAVNPMSVTSPKFRSYDFSLDEDSWKSFQERARRAGVTPSVALLAAFAEILGVWSRNPHFTINLTLFNRLPLHVEVNDIVGDFTSLTLLEVQHATNESLGTRAHRLQEQLWSDLDHRDVSGIRVMREQARREGRLPRASMPVVFTSVLGLDGTSSSGKGLEEFGEIAFATNQTPQVWLDHGVSEQGGRLLVVWNTLADLFPAGMLDDMFGGYCGLLEELAGTDESWQSQERKVVPAHQAQRRASINATSAPLGDDLLQSSFERMVRETPEAEAVITPGRRLSYGELSARAATLGKELRRRGVKPNTLVAVVMEKGWEQIVGVYGVLMSGGAYLPLDADLPKERLWSLLERGEVREVVTVGEVRERVEWPEGMGVIAVDEMEWEMGTEPPARVQGVEDLAYVIFTSGSTGEPKGVMIDHRGAVNTIEDLNERYGIGRGDRVLGLSSLSFDLSVYDIFGMCGAGGAVVLPGKGMEKDPGHWQELMEQERVTVWNTVPALMQMQVEYQEGRGGGKGELRLVMLSGDWIPVSLPERVKGDGVERRWSVWEERRRRRSGRSTMRSRR